TPRANASSSYSPDPRVSRPTKTRAPSPDQSADALPSRSTRATVRNSPTHPRTPSGPQYWRTGQPPNARGELADVHLDAAISRHSCGRRVRRGGMEERERCVVQGDARDA